MKLVICPNCGSTVGEQFGGKVGLALAGLYFGRHDPVAAAVLTLLGMVVGHILIDSAIWRCPQCGIVLRLATGLL